MAEISQSVLSALRATRAQARGLPKTSFQLRQQVQECRRRLHAETGLRSIQNAKLSNSPSRSSAASPWQSTIGLHSQSSVWRRQLSTGLKSRVIPSSSIANQKRTLFGGNTSQNLLAHMEQTANNNPSSATAQNAFYSALLRAGMPEILIERYQSNRFATNPACDQMYLRALERVGAAESSGAGFGAGAGAGYGQQNRNPGGMNNDQMQAVGQAIAARTQGSNVSITARQGSGQKKEPLYVVVDESLGSTIFKWFKFIAGFAFVCYISLVIMTLAVDATGAIKKVGQSTHAEAKPEMQKTKFSDVQGCDEAKEELQELVEFLKSPDKFSTLGGKLPKGVLLVGPPGTGKTLLARAVAGEAGVPFFYMSGSEFDEVYVGVGAKRVRDLFSAARGKSPAIIFIDELDAIGSKRHERDAAYAKQTLNQLLTELDGFEQDTGVIIIGATNFPESLDKALTRPGRFDRNVAVSLPDVRGRIAILKHHMKNIRFDAEVDPETIARGTPGFSGAQLENIVNQAAVRASKNKAKKVVMDDMEWAKDKILMGAEKRSMVIQEKDKIMTAFHEGGHALVAMLSKDADPLYKATIMPRGHALGITFQLPELDKVSESKKQLQDRLDVYMGGKVAEELVYGAENVTTGASSDIQGATQIAYMMVTRAGMSSTLGNIDLSSDYSRLSSETKQRIEDEVRKMIDESYDRAKKLLTENRKKLDLLAAALVEYETLDKKEMEAVVRGEKLTKKIRSDPEAPAIVPEAKDVLGIPAPSGGVSGAPQGVKGAGGIPAGDGRR
ncbi:mitochondrial inner membrane i-AAA protease supercomplex subunit YME1 [Elsinoe australis]|uniref:Mitochondrial inner membrane i-AAA protease supercomplex subunit YME1 n=1 Tax=Elsinoe australis TaxID=40998 RepID=A0A4U7AZ84_9PEZI|nr:mitochondrial inner membrane i-AAA protease supercomplex subunit YME1 [Elsinoe australis]